MALLAGLEMKTNDKIHLHFYSEALESRFLSCCDLFFTATGITTEKHHKMGVSIKREIPVSSSIDDLWDCARIDGKKLAEAVDRTIAKTWNTADINSQVVGRENLYASIKHIIDSNQVDFIAAHPLASWLIMKNGAFFEKKRVDSAALKARRLLLDRGEGASYFPVYIASRKAAEAEYSLPHRDCRKTSNATFNISSPLHWHYELTNPEYIQRILVEANKEEK